MYADPRDILLSALGNGMEWSRIHCSNMEGDCSYFDKYITVENILEENYDPFKIEEHFNNWLTTVIDYKLMMLKYESLEDTKVYQKVLDFFGVEGDYNYNWEKRKASYLYLPIEQQIQITHLFENLLDIQSKLSPCFIRDDMSPFIIVAYYTKETLYEAHAERLKASLIKYGIPHHIKPIDNLGNWHLNTAHKPTFLLEMMERFPQQSIVYVDCDAIFSQYPVLFDVLDCNVAAHWFDRTQHIKSSAKGFELLSGTIFFKNVEDVRNLVRRWEEKCSKSPYIWDQKHLEALVGEDFFPLPSEYCKIFDTMHRVEEPVITHYQASRTVRRNKGCLI